MVQSIFLCIYVWTYLIKHGHILAVVHDLELVFVKNSHEVVHEYMKKTEFVELMRRLGALGDGNQDQSKSQCFDSEPNLRQKHNYMFGTILYPGTLSADEWDAAYLYLSFVLRKVCLLSFIFFRFQFFPSLIQVCFNREEENLMEVKGEEGGGRMGK